MPRYTLLLAGCLLLTSSATAQTVHPTRLNVSVQGGIIRNLQNEDEGQPLHAFYPEVQIASRPFSLVRGISLQGGLHWGYWDDGVREHKREITPSYGLCGPPEEPPCVLTTYSQSSHIVGSRFYVVPTQIPFVSLSLFSGLSWHFVSDDYVGGSGLCISTIIPECELYPNAVPDVENYTDHFKALEVGLRVAVPLGNRLAVTAEMQKYVHIPIEKRNPHTRNRFAYKLGLSFGFF